MGLAVVIIYKSSKFLNLAQGEMALITTFFTYLLLTTYGVSFQTAFPLSLAFAAALGAVLEFAVIRRAKEPTLLNMIIITIGLQMILLGLIMWLFGPDPVVLPLPVSPDDSIAFNGLLLNSAEVISLAAALFAMLILFLFLRFNKLGTAIKAIQQDRTIARVTGIRSKHILMLTWAVSSVLGGLAGVIASPFAVQPFMMWDLLFMGFAAALVGGMTSMPGVVLGAYALGIIENLFEGYLAAGFGLVTAFAIVVLILSVKPGGLFSRRL